MEGEPRFSLTLPLLFGNKSHGSNSKLEEVESNNHDSTTNGASFSKTTFNGLNALSGVGILSIPYALATGGWLSLVLFFGIALTSFYTGHLIKKCMDFDSNIRTYPDIGERAYGQKGRAIISLFMYIELYMVAAGFLILEGDNLNNLFPGLQLQVLGLTIGGKNFLVLVVAVVILPSVWLDNLSLLSYVSASGVVASAIILGSIVWTGAFDGVGFHHKGETLNLSGIPTAVSLFGFCYCAHPVFPTLYTSMKKKHQFSNVLLLCFILCTLSYASMAVLGYLMFGPGVQSQITLNLPTSKLSSKVAIYTTLVNPIAKYALMVKPIVDAIKHGVPCPINKRLYGLLIGTTLLISSVIVALVMPFFASLMSLVGAFLSVTASIVIPCLCYMKISGVYLRFGCEMVTLVVIVLLGLTVAAFGTYTSLLEIIANLRV